MVLSRQVTAQIKEVLEKHPEGLSITDLVESVDINRNTAGRYLENLLLSGQVEMRRFGMAKIYTLAKRLPVSSVLSMSSDLVLQLDISQRVFYANDTLLSFLGAPAKDLFGKNIEFTPFATVFEDVFPELLERFRKGLKGEEWHGELARPVRGSSFSCRVTPSVSGEGTKGVSVLLEDISDAKRDEERIRKSEARLRSIFKVSPVGIGVVRKRILQEVNDRLCQMTGYTPEELVGKSARILYDSGAEFDRVGTQKYDQIRQMGTGSVETRWIKKDGSAIDVLLSSTPLDPANIPLGITFTAMDITGRKKAERELRESEEKFRYLVEHSRQGLIIVQDGKPVFANPAVRVITGYSSEEFLALGARELMATVHPDDRPWIAKVMADRLAGETIPEENEYRIVTKDKTIRWIHAQGVRITFNGAPADQITFIDVTGRKLAEQALRASEDRYRSLAEASRDIIFVIGRDDRVEFVNSYAAATLGLPAAKIIGKKRSLLFPGEPGQRQARGLQRVFETGNAGRSEGAMEFAGVRRWFDHYLTPIAGGDGTIVSVLGVSRDITDRILAGQALRESEDRYRKLVEISPDAVFLHQDGKIIYVNPAAVGITGAGSSAGLIGREMLDLIHPDDRNTVRENIRRDLAGETTPVTALRLQRQDGKYVFIEGRGVSTVIEGRPAVLVAIHDITDRHEAGLAVRKSEERYRSVFENTGAATAIIEENTIISFMNTEFERFSGYTKREIEQKKSWTDFVAREDRERMIAWHYQRRENQNPPRQYEFGFIKKNGDVRRVLVTVGLIPGTTQTVASLLDVTDRRLADERLLQREQQYRFIADNSLDIINRQTPECICTYVSPAITHLLGYTEIEVLGRRVLDLVHPEDLPGVTRDIAEIVRNGSSHVTSTFRFRHRDGHYLWFESTTRIVRDEKTGQVREFLSISRDITSRRTGGRNKAENGPSG